LKALKKTETPFEDGFNESSRMHERFLRNVLTDVVDLADVGEADVSEDNEEEEESTESSSSSDGEVEPEQVLVELPEQVEEQEGNADLVAPVTLPELDQIAEVSQQLRFSASFTQTNLTLRG